VRRGRTTGLLERAKMRKDPLIQGLLTPARRKGKKRKAEGAREGKNLVRKRRGESRERHSPVCSVFLLTAEEQG